MRDLTAGSIGRHVAVLAAPIAFGTLLQTSLLYVEGYFVAQLGNAALAGVSTSSTAIIIAFAFTQVVSVSAVALVSHAVGRHSRDEANHVFNQSMVLALICMIATLVAGYGLAETYMRFLGADEATVSAGVTYLYWTIPAFALQFPLASMGSALRGTGIVNPTVVVQTSTVILNALLDPILIGGVLTGHPLGLQGAGLARTIAAVVAVAALLFYFIRLERYVAFTPSLWRPNLVTWRRMFVIGIPAGGEFAIIALFITLLYWVLRDFGAAAQAAFGLGARLLQGLFQPVMSTTFPAAAIAGQNFGAKQFDRVRATFVLTASAVCAIFVALAALCTWQADWMARLFTSNEDVVALTSEFIRISSWAYVFLGLTFSCSGLFQAMGNTWPVLAINAWRVAAFFIPVLWLKGRAEFKLEHVWYLLLASAALEAAFALWLLRREYRARLVLA